MNDEPLKYRKENELWLMFCVTDSYAVFCLESVSFVMQEVTNDYAKGYGWDCEK